MRAVLRSAGIFRTTTPIRHRELSGGMTRTALAARLLQGITLTVAVSDFFSVSVYDDTSNHGADDASECEEDDQHVSMRQPW